jgi:hypothetical protein
MEKDTNIDLIEQFLNGELDDDEKASVEKTIRDDADFAREVEMQKLLMDGIRYSGRKKFREKLKTWDEELLQEGDSGEVTPRSRTLRWYYVAASLSVIVIAAGILLTNMGTDYAKVSSLHFKPYQHLPTSTRGGTDDQNALERIIQDYDQGNYNETIQQIQALDPGDQTELSNFILANSYQAIDEFQKAITLYDGIIKSHGLFEYPSRWYVALCYLSIDQYGKAKPLLEELAASNSSYSREAKDLLKDL